MRNFWGGPSKIAKDGPKWGDAVESSVRQGKIALEQSRLGLTHTSVRSSATTTKSVFSPAPHTTPVPTDIVNSTAAASNKMGTFKGPQGPSTLAVTVVDAAGSNSGLRTIFYQGPSGSFKIENATLADSASAFSMASAPAKVARRTIFSEYSGIGAFGLALGGTLGTLLYTTGGGNIIAANPGARSSSGGPASGGSASAVTAQHPAGGQPSPGNSSSCDLSDDRLLSGLFDAVLPELFTSFGTIAPPLFLISKVLFCLYQDV